MIELLKLYLAFCVGGAVGFITCSILCIAAKSSGD